MARQEGGQCSIGLMRARTAWLAGATGAAIAVYRRLRRIPAPPASAPDPRAEELRRRLDESRAIVAEREEFEAAETPVDAAEPGEGGVSEPAEVEGRRRAVHERGRAAADEMRGAPPE
jgi:hypothetical protein